MANTENLADTKISRKTIMFTKILVANRGAAAPLHRLMHGMHAGDFTPMEKACV